MKVMGRGRVRWDGTKDTRLLEGGEVGSLRDFRGCCRSGRLCVPRHHLQSAVSAVLKGAQHETRPRGKVKLAPMYFVRTTTKRA